MIDSIRFENVSSYLIIGLPFFLISGPFLSDLTVTFISVTFLIKCIKLKNFSFFNNFFFKLSIIFYLYLILNSFINFDNIYSLKYSFTFIRFPVFIIAVIFLLNNNKKLLNYFFYSLLLSFLILLIDGFFQYFTEKNILGLKIDKTYRVSSFFGDELIMGSFLSRLNPILFGLFLFISNISKKNTIYFSVLFILSEVLIFLSGERSSLFFLNFSAVFMIIMLKNYKIYRLSLIVISMIVITLISKYNPITLERVILKTINGFGIERGISNNNPEIHKVNIFNKEIYIFTKQHTHHYLSAIKMYEENKFFGVGIRNFRIFCDDIKYKISDISCSTHPHNTYIQFLSELGIVGIIFLIFSLIILLSTSIYHLYLKTKNQYFFSDFEICMMSTLWIYLWPIVPTGNFFNNWLLIVLCIPISFLLWSKKMRAKV